MVNDNSAPIDLVYLWVDDTDYDWKRKRNTFLQNPELYNPDAVDICRFYNNNELLFSLRSVEKNIPWINKIFIISDSQIPEWLDTSNPKIKIVNHYDIIPNDKLPIFNSCAIETRIPYIEELSEKFIYANDDMLFWQPIKPDFFFDEEKPIYIAGKKFINKKYKHLYGYTVTNASKLVKEKFGISVPYFPHHNADPYTKSLFLDCIKEFQNEFDRTLDNRFRDFSDIQRTIIMHYSVAINKAILKNNQYSFWDFIMRHPKDSLCFDIKLKTINKIRNANCKLLCVNDSRKTTDKARELLVKLLEQKFPNKSEFEK